MTTTSRQHDIGSLFASATLLSLLRLLVLEPERERYQRELQRLTGAHLRQLQRDLTRLEDVGLVARSSQGNRSYYRAVETHPAFAALRLLVAVDVAPKAPRLAVDRDAVAAFCRRWGISELALFGSVLRDDFTPDSDVDVLLTFAPGAERSLLDYSAMQAELSAVVGRRVDLVNREAVEKSANWIRRRAILESAERVYAA